MPVQYESVIAEHQAVREGVGVFDVSHLGRLAVTGPDFTEVLRRLLCNDVADYEPGRTHYTMMLNESGGIIDDIVVWRWDDHEYWVMPNAANSLMVQQRLAEGGDVTVEDLRSTTVMLAVQGPRAPDVINDVMGEAPRRFRTLETERGRLAGTGYTGEKGGEICVGLGSAVAVFEDLVGAGAVACGLGARDTLRLEAGLPLWGSDIDATTTPLEAGLDFAVKWGHEFVGKVALEIQADTGPGRLLTGLVMGDRGIPRHDYPVRTPTGSGVITSGNMSPVLGTGIALAYLEPPVEVETSVEVEIRNRWVAATTADTPFHR